jgi:hypothetical protein
MRVGVGVAGGDNGADGGGGEGGSRGRTNVGANGNKMTAAEFMQVQNTSRSRALTGVTGNEVAQGRGIFKGSSSEEESSEEESEEEGNVHNAKDWEARQQLQRTASMASAQAAADERRKSLEKAGGSFHNMIAQKKLEEEQAAQKAVQAEGDRALRQVEMAQRSKENALTAKVGALRGVPGVARVLSGCCGCCWGLHSPQPSAQHRTAHRSARRRSGG